MRTPIAACAALLLCSALPAIAQVAQAQSTQAQAQTQAPPGSAAPTAQGPVAEAPEPYHIGAALAYTHDSNLFRLPDGVAPPTAKRKRSDAISTASVIAGLDRSFGRQRVRGTASLKHNRFRENKQFDNEGHALNLALDWETINRLSGNVSVASNRSLRRFDPSEASAASERNVETVDVADATVRLGVVTRATVEANVNHRRVDYSSARFRDRAYQQTAASLGGRYRPAAATTFGAGLRLTEGRYPWFDDRYQRRDIDFTGRWEPGDGTVVNGRFSIGKTEYDRFTERNYSGPSGAIGVLMEPTCKIRLSLRAARDTGQDSAFLTYGTESVMGLADYSRTTTSARVQATYLATAKTQLQVSAMHARRSLATRLDGVGGSAVAEGRDRLTQWQIGPTWAPTRSLLFGCEFTHEQRSARGTGSSPYRSKGASCYGQFVMFPG